MARQTGKLFDLHYEIGVINNAGGGFYAQTVLHSPTGVMFYAEGNTPAAALAKVALDMEATGTWGQIARDPSLSFYPFNGGLVKVTQNAYNPNAPKQRPSDIHSVPHPDCQSICQAFDNFADTRCKSICGHRKGI